MNIIKKLFNKDNQKDEENNSIELDGIPSIDTNEVKEEVVESDEKVLEEQYNMEPTENIPAKLYGVPNIRRIILRDTVDENKELDIKPEDNNPTKLYGVYRPYKEEDKDDDTL